MRQIQHGSADEVPGDPGDQDLWDDGDQVPRARSEDIARRRRIYTIQMAIRLACLLLLPFVPGWWRAVVLVGAVILPYTAVLMANDADVSGRRDPRPDPEPPARALPAASTAPVRRGPGTITIEEDGTIHLQEDEDPPEGRG